jgi:hypothetical protein
MGRHALTLDHHSISEAMKWSWASNAPASFGFYLSKLSVAFFLLRLVPHRKTAGFIYVVIGALTIAQIYLTITLTGSCAPLRRVWNWHVPGTCWPQHVIIAGPYVFNGKL